MILYRTLKMVDDKNSPSPTKKKSPPLSSSGVKKKKKDEVEEPLRSVHSPNVTSLPLVNYSQDMEHEAQKLCSSYDESDDDDDDSGSSSDYQLLSENEKYLESDQDEESGEESDDDMMNETEVTSESEDEDDDEEEEEGEETEEEEEEKEEDPENPDETHKEKETKPENDDKREENFLKDYCYNFYKLKNLKEAEKLLSEKQHLIHLLSNEVKITNLNIYKTIWKTVIFQVELQKHRVTNFEQKHLKEKLVGLVLFSFTKVSCVVSHHFIHCLFYRNIFFRKTQDVRKRLLSTRKRRLETISSRRSHPHTHHQLNRASNRKSQE